MSFLTYKTSNETVDSRLKNILNPNTPLLLQTKPFQAFQWIKNVLSELEISFDTEYNAVWRLFLACENNKIGFINKDVFSNGVNAGFSNNALSKEIPNGSLVFCYFVGNPYVYRSIDEMYYYGLGGFKESQLKSYLSLDTKANTGEGVEDTTPLNKLRFSEQIFLKKWDEVKVKTLINKKIPVTPLNHIGIFYNQHLFHLCSSIRTEPSENLRVVAYYPLLESSKESVLMNNKNTQNDIKNVMKKFNF